MLTGMVFVFALFLFGTKYFRKEVPNTRELVRSLNRYRALAADVHAAHA